MIVYDLRNRGLSDEATDRGRLEHGILNDVDDLEAVRLYFNLSEIDLIGHSYIVLRRNKVWADIQPDVRMLATRSDVGKALSLDEE